MKCEIRNASKFGATKISYGCQVGQKGKVILTGYPLVVKIQTIHNIEFR
jgi:hypothetical protein